MNRGTLFAAVGALITSGLLQACRNAAAPELVTAVDSLSANLASASEDLERMDRRAFATADSLLNADRDRYLDRFADTLDRPTAALLGDQFLRLRDAARSASDRQTLIALITATDLRLNALRTDLLNGALNGTEAIKAVQQERSTCVALDSAKVRAMNDHAALLRALERTPLVESLLADTGTTPLRR